MPMTARSIGRPATSVPASAACARSATSSPACKVATAMSVSATPTPRTSSRAGGAGGAPPPPRDGEPAEQVGAGDAEQLLAAQPADDPDALVRVGSATGR